MSFDAISFGVGADISAYTTTYQLPDWIKSSDVAFNQELLPISSIDTSVYALDTPLLSSFGSLGDASGSTLPPPSEPNTRPYIWNYRN